MTRLVDLLNTVLTGAFGVLWAGLRPLGDSGALAVLAVVTGVASVWVYGRVSDQAAIARHKRRATGNLLGVRLFRDDLAVFLRLQGRILLATGAYAACALRPILVLAIPVALLLAQLDARLGQRPLAPGGTALLEVLLEPDADLASVALDAGDGLAVDTPAIRLQATHRAVWRLRALAPGRHEVTVSVAGTPLTKSIVVGGTGDAAGGIVSARRTTSLLHSLLHPGEARLPAGPVRAISVGYAAADLDLAGWRASWWAPFVVLCLGAGFALKGRLGVEV